MAVPRSVIFLSRFIPSSLHARLHFRKKMGYWPRLDDPRTFSERLQVRKLKVRDELMPRTADKYLLRGYVREVLGDGYLPELYMAVERSSEIDLSQLPPAYVMKASHASGWNRLVTNGALTTTEARALADRWLSRSFYWERREWVYRPLTPRVVFEEHLSPDGRILDDYKIFLFKGKPFMIQVDRDRFTRHTRAYYDTQWRKLAVTCIYPLPDDEIPRPAPLEEMLTIASRLAAPFEFVRVDLYALPTRIIVGEMTHYPEAGVMCFDPPEFDRELGDIWVSGRAIDESFLAK